MAEEFKTIETQEQLDQIIKGRLERQKETLTKEHSEATAELQKKLNELETEKEGLSRKLEEYSGIDGKLSEYEQKIKQYETDSIKTRIAREVGIPWEMKDRIKGETEEEIKADAEALAKFFPKAEPPKKRTESTPASKEEELREAYRQMLPKQTQ